MVMRSARRLRLGPFGETGAAIGFTRVAGLVALLWATSSEHNQDGSPRVPIALLAVTSVAWLAWLVAERAMAPVPLTWAALALLSASGGAVGGLAPVGIAFPAVAVLATAASVGAAVATLIVAVCGASALTVSVLVAGSPHAIITEGLLAIAAAILGGATRHQYQFRAAQAEQLLAERIRADTEQARAAALAERNRIAREIHDVLAHSLGALSVQLEAADALLDSPAGLDKAREYLQQARRSAVNGLTETRTAVQALREGPAELCEQLATLASASGATLKVTGPERRLAPDIELALYRAAQEALSNARKHAPGAPVSVQLDYGPRTTSLMVENGASPASRPTNTLVAAGGGFGLPGMRERIALVGGELSAESHDSGWTVRALVPS